MEKTYKLVPVNYSKGRLVASYSVVCNNSDEYYQTCRLTGNPKIEKGFTDNLMIDTGFFKEDLPDKNETRTVQCSCSKDFSARHRMGASKTLYELKRGNGNDISVKVFLLYHPDGQKRPI